MARPKMNGLRYFPVDTAVYDEVALRRLRCMYGNDLMAYYLYLLCKIYGKEGYCVRCDEDLLEAASMDLNVKTDKLREMTDAMVGKEIFDAEAYRERGVLTSADIQLQYQEASRSFRRKIYVDSSLWLVDAANRSKYICFIGDTQPDGDTDDADQARSEEQTDDAFASGRTDDVQNCAHERRNAQTDDAFASGRTDELQNCRSFPGKENIINESRSKESKRYESKENGKKEDKTETERSCSFVWRPSEADKTKEQEKRENERGETEKNGGVFPVSSDNGGNMKAAPAVESPELFFLTEEEKRTIDRRDAEGIAEIVKRVKNEAPNRFSRLRQYFWKAGITACCNEDSVRVIC